jgi:hypothetical protein
MLPAHRSPRSHLVAVGILVSLFLAQSFSASLQKSPVFDEPPHIASGLSYIDTHVFHANLQHPPLLKEMSALSLSIAGIHWPNTPLAEKVIQGGPDGDNMEWPVGNDIIATNGPDRVMFWARLPFILLAGMLGFLIYWWGREMVGSAAALGALFLYALDPTILAHSFLVTTDVGVATFTVLFLFALWRYLQQPNWQRLVLCGLAMGVMLGAKFSAIFLLPITVILLLAAVRWPIARRVVKSESDDAEKRRGVEESLKPTLKTYVVAFAVMCVIAVVVIEALYFFPSNPFLYLTGLSKLNADHLVGHDAYFNGELSRRFYSYFVAAYLLKEPLASVILAGAGLAMLVRAKSTPVLTKLFLLLTPAVFVLVCTLRADDLGIRYIIPALPFAYLLGGLALSSLFDGKLAWGRYVGAIPPVPIMRETTSLWRLV